MSVAECSEGRVMVAQKVVAVAVAGNVSRAWREFTLYIVSNSLSAVSNGGSVFEPCAHACVCCF